MYNLIHILKLFLCINSLSLMLKCFYRLIRIKNLNTGFYKDLDTNFELACKMSERDFAHDELVLLLENGNIPEKQIAALKLDTVHNQCEADILMSNLTGCDGKIREAVALKINNILNNDIVKTQYFMNAKVFADASIDINANICRLVIDSVAILKQNQDFSVDYLTRLKGFINEAFNELDNFIFRDKKYVINKQLFKLYWCLEALKLFAKEMVEDELYLILEKASREREYTVREKVAQILVLLKSSKFDNLKYALKNDENYYVREVFK